ncbi:MAG TPA: type II and III secretion system protein family protein [Vicinamibacterales bacterium]|nr:type II and III secretion system protein family protein [Vicinamibacterales bacterium]
MLVACAAFVSSTAVSASDDIQSVRLMVGRSIVVDAAWPIARLSLTSSDIADAMVTKPNQVLVQGKIPGTISMFLWDRGGAMMRYDVTVERDLSRLTQQMQELFPGEAITIEGNGKSIVVAGTVKTKYIADKAIEVAAGYVDKKEDVVSLVQVRDAGPPAQVLLRVRFAEVSRSALTELGVSLFTGADGYKNYVGRTATQQFGAPDFDNKGTAGGQLVFSDFLNLFLFDVKNQLGVAIRALQNKGLFQSLAEPNLVAESGKEASFLAGGEFPIPVAQGGSGNLAISVVFKEFGVRLNFTPTVTGGDRVRLKVRPEVSTLDFNNAIVLQGFRIPALSTRRTETEIELQDGQTFAIAGLLNNSVTQQMQKIPGIGDIPILGHLFRSRAAQKNQTELVVMITPQILPRMSSGVTADLPRLNEPYMVMPEINKSFPTPPPAFTTPPPTSPRSDAAQAGAVSVPVPAASTPTASEAAAVLNAQKPRAPQLVTPAPPAVATAPAAEPPSTETRPLSADDKKAMEKTVEAKRKADEEERRGMKAIAKREAKEIQAQRRRDAEEQKKQQQQAREQGLRQLYRKPSATRSLRRRPGKKRPARTSSSRRRNARSTKRPPNCGRPKPLTRPN